MQFSYTGNLKDIQNKLVAQSIREVSNIGLLKSEEAILSVIKSYTDRFKSVEGRLTDARKYIVNSRDVIKVQQFNDLFESIHIDLASLYGELELVDTVLGLNLHRNKNYISIIKKRIADLWLRLHSARLNIYDSNPGSESYYESFNSQFNLLTYNNITVDKKFGVLHLTPIHIDMHNESTEIKSITASTYPANNEEGGVLHTTNILNTFLENYSSGPRDMLKNGLWKEEVLTSDIPDMCVNIGDIDNKIFKSYKGVVSLVDIEFSSATLINRFDFDLFGDMVTSIDQILYKTSDDSEWKTVVYEAEDEDTLEIEGPFSVVARGSSFNVLNFMNLVPIKATRLRIIFLKSNYSLVDSTVVTNDAINKEIFEDFSERRYEVFRFGTSIDDQLSAPVNDENFSLYSKIMEIIESTRDIDRMLHKINKLLNPQVQLTTVDFQRLLKYEVGAWSIEPYEETYTNSLASFQSINYKLADKSLISVSLLTKQSTPKSSSCTWYVNIGKDRVPILENSSVWRKEPANTLKLSGLPIISNFPGTFILLDFPIDVTLASTLKMYHNGELLEGVLDNVAFFNTRLLYLDGLTFESTNLVVRYPVDQFECVNLYGISAGYPDRYSCGIVSSRRTALQCLVDNVPSLKEKYVVSSILSTRSEARQWFGSSFSKTIFVDNTLGISTELLQTPVYSIMNGSVVEGLSKIQSTYSDVSTYLNGGASHFNYECMSFDCGIVPMIRSRR